MHVRQRPLPAVLTTAILLGISTTAPVPSAQALTLGGERVDSSLGQPLVARFSLRGVPESLPDATCIRLAPAAAGDGLPQLTHGTLTLERRGADTWLVLRSPRPVNDPAIRVSLVSTCDGLSRRDYVLLLDPPLIVAGPGRDGVVERPAPQAADTPSPPTPSTPPPERARDPMLQTPQVALDRGVDATERGPAARTQRVTPPQPRPARSTQRAPAARDTLLQAPTTEARVTGRDRLEIGQAARPSQGVDDASLAALAVPRLRLTPDIAFDVGTTAPPSGASPVAADPLQRAIAEARRARLRDTPIEEDLPPRLEADFVVAKRRIEELQAQLAAQRAALPATPSPRSETQATGSARDAGTRWIEALPWVGGAAAVTLLLGALFWARSRRSAATRPFELAPAGSGAPEQAMQAPVTAQAASTDIRASSAAAEQPDAESNEGALAAVPPAPRSDGEARPGALDQDADRVSGASMAPTLLLAPEAAPPAPSPASARPAASSYQANASDVDVQELSHVTEEAQVYVEVGRIDQAIALLKAHVETQDTARPSPAPWLMLLDLYRRTGNREAYDELAPKFQQRFNGRMPAWDSYGHELALDDGLEAFPHLVSRISREWRTRRARDLLEELLYDNRGGSRLGFSLAAYRDILLLLQIHDAVSQSGDGLLSLAEPTGPGADDGTPKWTLDLDTVDGGGDSKLGQWLDRPKAD